MIAPHPSGWRARCPPMTLSISAPRDAHRADRYYQPQDEHPSHAAAHDDRHEQHHGSHEQDAAHDTGHEAQYDDRYRVAPPPAGDYDGDHYYAEDGHMPPQGDETVPSRRRGGLLTIAAVLGLAAIGTAGAFGYRAYTAGPGGSANPPVIKADTTPAKIVPPAAASADAQGKPFQERVGTATTERIVPREEQPVSLPIPPQPRPNAPQTAFAPTGAPPLVAPPPSTAPGAFNEPKRVKTLAIRPDTANDATALPPANSPARAPVGSAKQTGPMAIAPQSEPTPTSRTKTAVRTPAAAAAGGAYVVQVSAQRSEAEAQSSYRALQQKYPNLLGGREPSIRRVDLGDKGGVYYRAQVGSFATLEQANAFCGNLRDAGGQCIAQKN